MPLLGELSRSSSDLFESDSDSNESRDDRLNSPKSCVWHIFGLFRSIQSKKSKKCKTPLFSELSQSSRDLFESEYDSNESRDDRLNSPKSCVSLFWDFFDRIARVKMAPSKITAKSRLRRILRPPLFAQFTEITGPTVIVSAAKSR